MGHHSRRSRDDRYHRRSRDDGYHGHRVSLVVPHLTKSTQTFGVRLFTFGYLLIRIEAGKRGGPGAGVATPDAQTDGKTTITTGTGNTGNAATSIGGTRKRHTQRAIERGRAAEQTIAAAGRGSGVDATGTGLARRRGADTMMMKAT